MSTLTVKNFAACTHEDVADAVLTLAAPLCAACDDDAMKHHLISLAVTGWNLSLFESREKEGYRPQVEERLPAQLPAEQKEVFVRVVLDLITAKQSRYPAMMKGIKSWDLRTDNGELTLSVEALPVKPV